LITKVVFVVSQHVLISLLSYTVTGRNLVQFPCDCLLHGAFLANLK